ncbi:MAG: hypothetical protein J3Q66DRAFT_402521 [Benniella sp.]|nr:MAG: hypothetical protein J3Q66DRAFT_402521 [Benniella sp.]
MAKVSLGSTRISDRIVMRGNDQDDKAQGFASQKFKDIEHVEYLKDDMKHKAHDVATASKASLAVMLTGIEATFRKLYEYEDMETTALWSKLHNAIDDHAEAAKKS